MVFIEITEDELGLPHVTERHITEQDLGRLLFPHDVETVSLEDIVGADDPSFNELETKDAIRKLLQHAGLTPLELETLKAIYWEERNYIRLLLDLGKKPKQIERIHQRALAKLRRKALEWRLLN